MFFFGVVAGVFVEEELVGFVLCEVSAIDHHGDELEYAPQSVTSGPGTGRVRWLAGAEGRQGLCGEKHTPAVEIAARKFAEFC
jgi:hypothetical protein